MNVALIPVIEIVYGSQGIDFPTNSPYWEYPEEWQAYFDKCYLKAGFKDKFIPYSKGSGLYRPKDISDDILVKIIEDLMDTFKDGEMSEENLTPLFGGYVLRVNDQDALFPQCCSDLGDWVYWRSIVKNRKKEFFNGHPAPIVEFADGKVIFICKDEDEDFVPPTDEKIVVNLGSLEKAYNELTTELKEFASRVSALEGRFSFKISNNSLENILIYGDSDTLHSD